jgi:hypothetical protein
LLLPGQQSLDTVTDWECIEAPVMDFETGNAAQIVLSVTNQGSGTVFIDDLRLVLEIFSDGFESGDTTNWTITVQ